MSESTSRRKGDLILRKVFAQVGACRIEADFRVGSSERLALTGPSGSGKTTLLRLIAGLEALRPPSGSGKILIGESEITHVRPEQRNMGLVFQDHALFPTLSVMDNATFGLRMRGVSKKEREAIARPYLERVGLAQLLGSSVETLSGGEKQRLALVRAIAWKPDALLLDEPFSALDPALRSQMRRDILDLHELWPVPLLIVTHDETDISELATTRISCDSSGNPGIRRFVR